ncbi:hypothetical protein CR3_gp015 [Cronobacter phage CR3]|uniref:Phage neck terminator protein gp12-like domain-containing protein n=1 Tax=Cronobacter phage CR3 TaxID=1162295 RepID=I1TR57_9CAUD|nr:hypothetical protein CR3_gp015 [Cronobacter phage CR3]AFH21180.1 hypothetical protein CR3_015 [Cronobacter phage CR3]KAB3178452.1 hypothetical protein F9047_10995 [Escherichia coli]
MALPLDFTNSDVVMGALTKAVGRLCLDVTGYDVVEADETIPKPEGPYILVDLTLLTPLDWATNEVVDEEGVVHTAHNYTASYTLTAYRGKPHWALSRVHQAFGLPFIREKYFPTGSPYAYSSTSNIARMRVPLNQQMFENRARTIITFNATFVEKDIGAFEDVEHIIIGIDIDNPSGPPVGIEADYDKGVNPGGDDPGLPPKPNPPIVYHDAIAQVCMATPVIDKPALISDKTGE